METTYEAIKPLIVNEEIQDQFMVVQFQADGQDRHFEGRAVMPVATKKVVANAAAGAVKQGVIHQVLGFLGSFVGGAIGGKAGSIAASATKEAGRAAVNQVDSNKDLVSQVDDTPENRQTAAVEAFNTVSAFFEWDAEAEQWKAAAHTTV